MTAITFDDRRRPMGPRLLSMARESALTFVAVMAVVWLIAFLLSLVFGLSLVMFRTGSMSPTIPAGSVALVHEVDAASVSAGDVVTVRRPGALPVTHRVVSAERHADGSAELVLRGDANDVDDPVPYRVERVQRVVGSLAGVAPVLRTVTGPTALGLGSLIAAALITWAFWPRRNLGIPAGV